ncbi:TPA: undecaprenyl-phosphate glucose phosphotransferase [Klebsiella quasipneumoniae subsp. similipneumoniae]|uniref:undecaprenyl-phosphate glucose phosphotransferase n=1 Tax=Klebsiella quasipneumoniae TaxID=1463165 RepID=UPI0018CACCEE|nr:undecaprenyl-phosphate glucose phosphotransferase [Klebsiella quasipneumoniae]HBW2245979.1 undecaprenyl-phosphate glucose phosphotransferase [Klebsiella quasipneumoniae subsp. similipneumoniae]ELA0756369.1 undecaprenyl-phosphate glucose phosphotransferase [Klebsiella quasipneumoniae]MBG9413471.1 undecaprenyl-phosphate glucose phosphotransferase [Klebsiella quasipneumoniae]HDH1293638.1 undecaprenyl-phosphate glucose phosphotransferase [Klebsiella quasipneumoniae subsp. similipneumoniae]HDT52
MTIHYQRANANASLISMVQRFSDIVLIFASLYAICLLNGVHFEIRYLLFLLIVLAIFQMVGGITDFYRSWRGVKISAELKLILKNWSLSYVLALGIISLFNDFDLNIRVAAIWFIVVTFGFVLCRTLIRVGAGILRRLGYNTRRVAVVGSLPAGINLLKGFAEEPWMGFIVLGYYNSEPLMNVSGINFCGNFDKLINDARDGKIDRIYIAMNMQEEAKIKKIVQQLTDTTCSVLLIPDIFTFNILQARTEEINGVPVVPLFDTPLSGINMIFKRLEDVIVSTVILILISPVLLIISVAVKFSSPGPVLFRQLRYGMDGKPIRVWKFRSMRVMENDKNVVQATKNDIRVTKVGKFLRSTSLDELPQFFNVLCGQMSVVGPRPHAVAHNEQYRALIQGYMLRHKVKPGITGLAQINGWRGETDTLEKMEKRIEYDLLYIRGWSIWLDLKIIFLTVFKGFINKSAY